jgi:hypothetical protein
MSLPGDDLDDVCEGLVSSAFGGSKALMSDGLPLFVAGGLKV